LTAFDSTLFRTIPDIERISSIGREGAALNIHRLDQVFPLASGNKAFKLIGHVLAAKRAGKSHLLSFGGAWSNHLHAMALLSAEANWRSTAIVRGLSADLDNPTLRDAQTLGMRMQRVSKDEYARRYDPVCIAELQQLYPDAWIVPEGGDDALGRWGLRYLAESLLQSIPSGDTLVVPAGTGATVRGLARCLQGRVKLVCALVVKDTQLAQKLDSHCRVSCPDFRLLDASGRGYGRISAETIQSIENLYQHSGVLLDPLYNGKALAVAVELADAGESVHLLHTGGVQGWRGFHSRGMLQNHPHLCRALEESQPSFSVE